MPDWKLEQLDFDYIYRPILKKEFQEYNLVYLYYNIKYTLILTLKDTVPHKSKPSQAFIYKEDGTTETFNITNNFLLQGSGTSLSSNQANDHEFPYDAYKWKINGM